MRIIPEEGEAIMNQCENCIHNDVCKMWWYDAEGGCPHRKTESDALHTLRLIYADIMGRANRYRSLREQHTRGKPWAAVITRCKAETYISAAYVVAMYCRKIGLDLKGEQNGSIREETAGADRQSGSNW